MAEEATTNGYGRYGASANKIFWVMCFAQFIVPYMVSAVGIGIPAIGNEFHATALQLGFIEQFYLLPMGMAMLTFGRTGDILGYGKVFAAGFIVFTVFTILLGFATNIHIFLVLRFLQGLAAAIVLSVSLSLISSLFPPEVRGRKFGVLSGFIYGGLSAGPVIGGLLTTQFGWRSLFYSAAPFCIIISIFCVARMWKAGEVGSGEKMDYKGSLLYALALLLFTVGGTRIALPNGWIIFVLGILGVILFYFLERKVKFPLVNVDLLRSNKALSLGLLAAMGNYASTFGLTFFLTLYLQYYMGLTPRAAGLILLVQPLVMVVLSPWLGRLADRVDPGKLSNIGIGIICIFLLAIAGTVGSPYAVYLIPIELLFIGIGYGVFIIPNTLIIMGSVEPKEYGVVSGLIGTMRVVGMVISITAVNIIFTLIMRGETVNANTLPQLATSMRIGLVVLAVFAFLGVFSAWWSSRELKAKLRAKAQMPAESGASS